MIEVLKKVLNPFEIRVTGPGKAFVRLGALTSVVLHLAFYATIVHFVHKAW